MSYTETKHEKALADQVKFDIERCQEDKKITEDISHGLQNSLDAANRKLNTLKLRDSRCVLPVTKPATGHDAAARKSLAAGQDGISTEALYDFAGDAERYRLQLVSCQGFIKKVWKRT